MKNSFSLFVFTISPFAEKSNCLVANGASPQKNGTKLQQFTKTTGIKTKVVVLDWGEAESYI